MATIAVFGDIGGHRDELYAELVRLGADADTLTLPDGLTVVLDGDLIHRGPDSAGVLELAATLLDAQPEQTVLLSGNHEAQYFAEPRFGWPERLPAPLRSMLRGWWADGRMRVAAGVTCADGEEILITHAGLTMPRWRMAGAPSLVAAAAAKINSWIPGDPCLWRAGAMLNGGITDSTAGPWWAEASSEVYGPWVQHVADGGRLPFSQIHGHSSVYWWEADRYMRNCPQIVREHITLDRVRRHAHLALRGGRIIGIDPGHGKGRANTWAPLVFENARITAR